MWNSRSTTLALRQEAAIRTKRLTILALLAVALVVSLVVLWPKQPRYPPIVQAGIKLIDCQERVDADCMYEFIPDEERKLYGLSRATWKWFVTDYGRDTIRATSLPGGKVEYYGNEARGWVRVSRPSTDADGKRGFSSAVLARTDKGYQAPYLAMSLIIGITAHRGRTRPLEQSEWRAAMLKAFERDGALLTAHGFKGYPIEGEFLTWDEHVTRLKAALGSGRSLAGQ